MKQPNLLKFLCSILIGAGLCFVAAGCVQLERKYPDIRTYSLDVSSQGHGSYAGLPVSLRLNSFSSVPQAVDRYLLYRTGETAYESDFYNQLMTAPAEMIHDQAATWLKGSPLVRFVLKPGEASCPFYGIDGTLVDIYGDYRDANAPKAVLRLKITVSETDESGPDVVLQKIYSQEVPMKNISPAALSEGWNLGLCRILADFESDLKELIAGTIPQNG